MRGVNPIPVRRAVMPLTVVTAALTLWEIAARHRVIDTLFFSSPSAVAAELGLLVTDSGLVGHLLATVRVLGLGWFSGVAVGVALGLGLGLSGYVERVLSPFLAFMNAMPRLLLLPLFIVWFGFGLLPKVLLVLLVIVFGVALTVASGVRSVPRELVVNARVLGARPHQIIGSVYLPSVVLWIFTTSRTSLGFAFQAAVAAEFLGAAEGLGFLLVQGQATFDATRVWAVICVMLLMGSLLDQLLAVVESACTKWVV